MTIRQLLCIGTLLFFGAGVTSLGAQEPDAPAYAYLFSTGFDVEDGFVASRRKSSSTPRNSDRETSGQRKIIDSTWTI